MHKFFNMIALLAVVAVAAAPSSVYAASMSSEEKACKTAGFTYSRDTGVCILIITDENRINDFTPANTDDDPHCDGKPVGTVYYTKVHDPVLGDGVAKHVCGVRPKA